MAESLSLGKMMQPVHIIRPIQATLRCLFLAQTLLRHRWIYCMTPMCKGMPLMLVVAVGVQAAERGRPGSAMCGTPTAATSATAAGCASRHHNPAGAFWAAVMPATRFQLPSLRIGCARWLACLPTSKARRPPAYSSLPVNARGPCNCHPQTPTRKFVHDIQFIK